MLDRDLQLFGLAGACAAIATRGPEIAAVIEAGAQEKNKDMVPMGRIVTDPAFRAIMEENGFDPNLESYPPIDAKPGEYTLNDQVVWAQGRAKKNLGEWLPLGRGTERGVNEVDLVNGFVEELFPLVSDEGAEWSYSLGPAEKVLHDFLNGDLPWPEELSYEEQIAYVEGVLRGRAEGG